MKMDAIEPGWRRRFRRNLRAWYSKHARELPWRMTHDAYRIWISEIMLQQTTVAAVIPYYERFLSRFPTVEDLAAAQEEDVLRIWEGLGYYSRARNMHKTAQQVVESYGGHFPSDVDRLRQLPGIGRYTAGAIASFAFDRAAPIVEANTLRLYCRLLGYRDDPRSKAGQQRLWEFAQAVLPAQNPGRFNQALIELGGVICTPNTPDCPKCPVRNCCQAYSQSLQSVIPKPSKRTKPTHVTEVAIAVRQGSCFLLIRQPEGQRWAGLWDFPRFQVTNKIDHHSPAPNGRIHSALVASLERQLHDSFGVTVEIEQFLSEIHHTVTRFRITLKCFEAEFHSISDSSKTGEFRWTQTSELCELPLSVTGRKLANLLSQAKNQFWISP